VTPTGPQHADLAVTLTAGTVADLVNNQLESVRFNAVGYGWIEASGRTSDRGSFEVALPAGTGQFDFVLHADTPGTPPTAHVVVKDACGAWPTFVGGYTPPPPPPLPAYCTPRPRVELTTVPQGADTLRTTLRVNGTGNELQAVEVGAVTNASLDLAGQTDTTGPSAVTLPPGTPQLSFTIHHGPGAYSVALTAVDGCGRWPTFVSAGSGLQAVGEDPVSCLPRPPVEVSTTQTDGGLQNTVRATGVANHLLGVEFGAATNSLVNTAGHALAPGDFTVSGAAAPAVTFSLRPIALDAYSVPLVVVDRCGRWPTLVGAGAAPSVGGGGDDPPNPSAATATPELDSLVLFGVGALVLVGVAWRRRQAN